MKPAIRQIANERMKILINNAMINELKYPEISQRQALLARKISSKYKIRMPYEIRITICKKCKKFITPGINSKIRVGKSSVKSIRITCNFCGHTYHKIIAQ